MFVIRFAKRYLNIKCILRYEVVMKRLCTNIYYLSYYSNYLLYSLWLWLYIVYIFNYSIFESYVNFLGLKPTTYARNRLLTKESLILLSFYQINASSDNYHFILRIYWYIFILRIGFIGSIKVTIKFHSLHGTNVLIKISL